jgi:hypothetical protein
LIVSVDMSHRRGEYDTLDCKNEHTPKPVSYKQGLIILLNGVVSTH